MVATKHSNKSKEKNKRRKVRNDKTRKPWGCTHTHTHTHTPVFYKRNRKTINKIEKRKQ